MLQAHHHQAIARGDLDGLHQELCKLKNPASRGVLPGYNAFDALLTLGKYFLEFGYCSDAELCFKEAAALRANDVRPLLNLANVYTQWGDHAKARGIYEALIQHGSTHAVVRRGLILCNEYDSTASVEMRGNAVSEWTDWTRQLTGEPSIPRPPLRPSLQTIGYLSADFCQHTVGLLFRGVLAHHDLDRFTIVCYYSGSVYDWVTSEIQARVVFRDVSKLSTLELAAQIRADAIDVLVDLSGHTSGSRVEVMALRPAPIQLSWLGYFSSVGLSSLDAVLMDAPHCTPAIESQFNEPIVKLRSGRLPFTPVPWTTSVSHPPSKANGYITYGSFNNTAKYSKEVLELWAELLRRNPTSKLVLKWRTFQDPSFRARVTEIFASLGVLGSQLELRGMSFHVDVLKQYADIDICLDTFPFSGGLTSLEALNQGVPVITLPSADRAVSRQTFAFYQLMGYTKCIASNEADYIVRAERLGYDIEQLANERQWLRQRLEQAPFCQLNQYTKELEGTYQSIYEGVKENESGQISDP